MSEPQFSTFAQCVERAGLSPVRCGDFHWKIRGGQYEVNVRPTKKRGLRMSVGNNSPVRQCQDFEHAIRAAGQPASNGHVEIEPPDCTTDFEALEALVRAVNRLLVAECPVVLNRASDEYLEALIDLRREVAEAGKKLDLLF